VLLIDTDPGIDDAHALAMATRSVAHDQLIVTTIAGNVGLDRVTDNAEWLLAQWAPSVPLFRGAATPLVGPTVDAAHIHGDDGLAGFPRERATAQVQGPPAASAIVDAARANVGELDIVALGPLTNLALAVLLEPALPDLVRSVTIMGGSPAQFGNASLNAEFNVFADAEAAEVTLSRMRDVTLLTWDTSLETRFTASELARMWSGDSVEARTLRALHEHRMANDAAYAANETFGRADPLAMAVALRPECVATSVAHRIHVVRDGGLAHGGTLVDHLDATSDRPPVVIPQTFHRDILIDALAV
jgi:purine nucleosidase